MSNWTVIRKIYTYIYKYIYKFPDLFRVGTFINSTHMKLYSSGCNALVVPFQQLLEGHMDVLLCERVISSIIL